MAANRPTYKDQGIVLHTTKYGERKLIIYILTASHGRCNYIVSVNKTTARALFQPLYLIEFTGTAPSQSDGLHTLKEPALCPALKSIPSSPIKAMIVMMLSEFLYRIVKESDDTIFNFVKSAIIALDSLTNSNEIANFHIHFMVHFAALLGYTPSTQYAVGDYFDIKEGCFTPSKPNHLLYMEPESAHILISLLSIPYYSLGEVKLNSAQRRRFIEYMIDYYGFHNDAIFSVRSISTLSDIL